MDVNNQIYVDFIPDTPVASQVEHSLCTFSVLKNEGNTNTFFMILQHVCIQRLCVYMFNYLKLN